MIFLKHQDSIFSGDYDPLILWLSPSYEIKQPQHRNVGEEPSNGWIKETPYFWLLQMEMCIALKSWTNIFQALSLTKM